MLNLDGFDAGLKIGFSVEGAQVATDAINALSDAFTGAISQAADIELLKKSLSSLLSAEMVNVGRYDTINAAMSTAQIYADDLYQTQALMAAQSPFSLDDIASAGKIAATYEFLATQTTSVAQARELDILTAQRVTQAVLDTVAATGQQGRVVNELVSIMGKANAAGKYMASDFYQMADRGVNVANILAKAWNVPTSEIIKMREQGKLTADVVNNELVVAMEKFYGGASAAAGATISGRMASFSDAMMFRQQDAFEPMIKSLSGALAEVNEYMFSAEAIDASRELGQNLKAMTDSTLSAASAIGELATGVQQNVLPALHGAGVGMMMYAAAAVDARVISMGGWMNAAAIGMWRIRTAATAAAAQVRAFVGSAAGLGVFATIGGTVTSARIEDYKHRIEDVSEALAHNTAGWKQSSTVIERYAQASPLVRDQLKDHYDALMQLREANEAANKEDFANAAKRKLLGINEDTEIAINNANIRSAQEEQIATSLNEQLATLENITDESLKLDVINQRITKDQAARLEVLQGLAKVRDSLVDEEIGFQQAMYDLESERHTKEADAWQTYRNAQTDARAAYHDAETAAKAAHDEALATMWQEAHTTILDETLSSLESASEVGAGPP